MRTRIKFCGLRTPDDLRAAVACGADAVGAILAPASPRCVALETLDALAAAAPPFVTRVAVLAGTPLASAARARELGYLLQFSGDEDDAFVREATRGAAYLRVLHVAPGGEPDAARVAWFARDARALLMFDTKIDGRTGGTGVPFAWDAVSRYARERPVVVAGGLDAENVAACVRVVRPFAVDVASGIEREGRKDPAKMRAFARAVRAADADAERDGASLLA